MCKYNSDYNNMYTIYIIIVNYLLRILFISELLLAVTHVHLLLWFFKILIIFMN